MFRKLKELKGTRGIAKARTKSLEKAEKIILEQEKALRVLRNVNTDLIEENRNLKKNLDVLQNTIDDVKDSLKNNNTWLSKKIKKELGE